MQCDEWLVIGKNNWSRAEHWGTLTLTLTRSPSFLPFYAFAAANLSSVNEKGR